jgi:hypothetical protein
MRTLSEASLKLSSVGFVAALFLSASNSSHAQAALPNFADLVENNAP